VNGEWAVNPVHYNCCMCSWHSFCFSACQFKCWYFALVCILKLPLSTSLVEVIYIIGVLKCVKDLIVVSVVPCLPFVAGLFCRGVTCL